MKKAMSVLVILIATLFLVNTAFAADCPQERKTGSAPAAMAGQDKTDKADKANGSSLYHKTAKPMACEMCHGKGGAGDGKLGKALKPKPRNFTCAETMKDISPGQMYFIIKNGSKGTGMAPMKLSDSEIWDVIKYVREDLMK